MSHANAIPPRPRIGIDARKLGDFGIGEYLTRLIEELALLEPWCDFMLLHQLDGPPPTLPPHMTWHRNDAGKYSLREQFSLPWQAWRAGLSLLHLPHYVTPLWSPSPLVVTVHDVIHLRFADQLSVAARAYARFMIAHAARSARHIITVSEHSRDDLVALAGADPAHITVVHNGITQDAHPIDADLARATAREVLGWEGPFLLTVANTRMGHKNLPRLVEAFAQVTAEVDAGLRLVIVGGAPPPTLQQTVARALGPRAGLVVFPGYLERSALLALYNACHAFVWPSLYEGFGLPPLEAMACGSPVISSDASVMPEVLGEAVHYCNPMDAVDMARAIREVLGDADLRERLIRRGRRQAAQFTWAEAARKTAAVYRHVLGMSEGNG